MSGEILGQAITDEPQQLPLHLGQHGQGRTCRNTLQVLANLGFGQMIPGVGPMLENQRAERLDILDTGLTNDQLAHFLTPLSFDSRAQSRAGNCLTTVTARREKCLTVDQ